MLSAIIEAIDSDSEYDELPAGRTALFKLDDWITFSVDPEAGQLALQLRLKWHTLLSKRLRMPNKPWTQVGVQFNYKISMMSDMSQN